MGPVLLKNCEPASGEVAANFAPIIPPPPDCLLPTLLDPWPCFIAPLENILLSKKVKSF